MVSKRRTVWGDREPPVDETFTLLDNTMTSDTDLDDLFEKLDTAIKNEQHKRAIKACDESAYSSQSAFSSYKTRLIKAYVPSCSSCARSKG